MNISDSILEAIDIVIQQRLQQLNFDNTIVCTVVDNSKREEGEYTVEYQDSVRLTAYSENKTYLNDSKVYVLVPEGDWSKQKTILGRYKSEDENTPITYIAPSAQVATVETKSSDIVYQLQTQTTGIVSDSLIILEIPDGAEIATISADFQALISDILLSSGRYGLYIEGYTSNNILDRSYTLGSVDVFGNPYNLLAPQRIEKNINIKGLKQLKIYAYEMDFTEKTGYVTISNISAIFGYDILSREDNTLEIKGEEPLRYNSSTDNNIERKISLFWFNKDKNNQYLGFSDGEFNEKAKPVENQQIDYDKTYYWIEWERSDDGGNVWKSIQKDGKTETIIETLNSTASTIFKAYLYVNGEKISSNTITYINEANDLAQTQLSVSLKMINDKNALDNYALYGANGVLNNSGDAYTERVLSYDYNLPKAHKESVKGSYLAEADTEVIWRIPVDSTMIAAPKVVEESTELEPYWILSTDKKYYEYHTKVTSVKGENGELKSVDLGNMSYRIKNTFEPWAINNTISLEIIQTINGTVYTYKAEKSISFSSFGNSGTSYTFIAKPSRQAYYIGETTDKDLVFELFDKNGSKQKIVISEPDEDNKDYIKATTKVEWLDKNTTLITYYPTATAANAAYSYEGPTFVTYDSFGTNPTYYREALKLHGYEGAVKWSAGENEKDINIKNKDSIFTAEFSNLFASDGMSSIRVWHINAYSENDELLWTQPVLGLQNKYGSDLLNNWDGSLQINANDNQVLAASIIAGTKSDNKFTGVAFGELNDIAEGSEKNISNGLLGFREGVQTFGFNIDGSAFIGPSGSGRIYFNGDPTKGGIIASQGWINQETGMPFDSGGKGLKINLQEGSLISQNFSIDANGDATFEGTIKAQNGNIGGWDISPGGLGKIVLEESGIWLDARPFSEDNSSAYYINCQNYKDTSKYFRVGKDGSIYATGAEISGNIIADSLTIKDSAKVYGTLNASNIQNGGFGATNNITIGGWNINNVSIYKGNTKINASSGQMHPWLPNDSGALVFQCGSGVSSEIRYEAYTKYYTEPHTNADIQWSDEIYITPPAGSFTQIMSVTADIGNNSFIYTPGYPATYQPQFTINNNHVGFQEILRCIDTTVGHGGYNFASITILYAYTVTTTAIAPNFGVTDKGVLYASSGSIGGWMIQPDCLKTSNVNYTTELNPGGLSIIKKSTNTRLSVSWEDIIKVVEHYLKWRTQGE